MFKGEKETYKDVTHQIPVPIMCNENYHESDVLHYCAECEVLICDRCGQTRHEMHRQVDFKHAAEEVKIQRRKVIDKAKAQIIVVEAKEKEQARLMNNSEQELEDTQTRAVETVERLIERLRVHETAMKMKLIVINKEQQKEHTKRLEELQLYVTQLKASIEHDERTLQQCTSLEILQANNAAFSLREEVLDNQEIKIYRPLHINYIVSQGASNISRPFVPGQIVASHTDPSKSVAEGKGLRETELEVQTNFKVTTRDSDGKQIYDEDDQLTVKIYSPTGEDKSEDIQVIEDCEDGSYTVRYKIQGVGLYQVRIEVNGRPLTGSPWSVQVTPHHYRIVFRSFEKGPSVFVFPLSIAENVRTGQIAVAGYSNKRIQLFNKQWKYLKTIGGGESRNALDIGHPISVAFLINDDVIFTREENAHREQMSVFTAQGQFIESFSGHVVRPLSVFVKSGGARDGQVIVSDVGDKKIKVLSPDGKDFLQSFSPPECSETAEFIFYHNGKFFASYQREDCVKVYSDEGKFLYDIGSSGSGDGEMIAPVGLAVDKYNQLIVCDAGNQRVQVFTLDGKYLYTITEESVDTPWFVAVSSKGDIWITDVTVAKHCIHVFS